MYIRTHQTELVDPLHSSRVAASPAVKISETLIHEITVRFIAWVIKRIPVVRAEYKTKENYNRAHFNAIIKCFVEDTSSFTNYILTSGKKSSLETAGCPSVIRDAIRPDYTWCRLNNRNLYRPATDTLKNI